MRTVTTTTTRAPRATLPREHGFWVLLVASLVSSVARSHVVVSAFVAAAAVALSATLAGALVHRYARRASFGQLAGAVALACAGVPVEVLGGLPAEAIAAGATMKAVVFSSSVLLVRAALVTSGKNGSRRSGALYLATCVLSVAGLLAFASIGRAPEALACTFTAFSALLLAWQRPTSKQLKPLGMYMTGLALVAAILEIG
jgi:hypothetical protein